MSDRAEPVPTGMVVAVLALTLLVLGLGGAILALKLRPAGPPSSATDRTVEAWRERVAAAPGDDRPLVGLGLALVQAARTDEAKAAFEDALEINPSNWVALTQLGELIAEEEPRRALELLTRGAEHAPRGSRAIPLVLLGDVHLELGEPEEAATAYRRALEDSPGVYEAHLGLARALEALGREREALAEYERAAMFDPTNREIARAIERLRASIRDRA